MSIFIPGDVMSSKNAKRIIPNRMTKSELNKKIIELRKYGFLVYGFNNNRPNRRNNNGFPDYVIIKNKIWFLEVKIGKDKLSDEQAIFRSYIENLNLNMAVEYFEVKEKNYQAVIDLILKI